MQRFHSILLWWPLTTSASTISWIIPVYLSGSLYRRVCVCVYRFLIRAFSCELLLSLSETCCRDKKNTLTMRRNGGEQSYNWEETILERSQATIWVWIIYMYVWNMEEYENNNKPECCPFFHCLIQQSNANLSSLWACLVSWKCVARQNSALFLCLILTFCPSLQL